MKLPEKDYYRICGLCEEWGVSKDDMFYIVENGLLQASIWLPLRYIERIILKDDKLIHECHEMKEGFVALRPEDCRKVCNDGNASLKTFNSIARPGHILKLTDEPPQPLVYVQIKDLLVLKKDKEAFEAAHRTAKNAISESQEEKCLSGFSASQDYHHIKLNAEEYHLGDVQAKIIEKLHDAAQSDNPWVHGKILIYDAGSEAARLRDLFKHNKIWKGLIISNAKGCYRLNIPIKSRSNELLTAKDAA